MVKVSRSMSTQHPDNVGMPFFSDSEVLAGEAEVKEAFYVFSQLGCREQMWDSEGKDVDNKVVEKLLSKYTDFFQKTVLGRDAFLTYRAPNPAVEKEQGKVLLETLHSIPRAFDVANAVSGGIPPIFEVILPMTTSAMEIEMIKRYYERVIIGQKNARVSPTKTVKEWVGDFQPETINVIPLFESFEAFREAPRIVEEYIQGKRMEYQRVFLARSDPALNYGSVSAVLMAKIALFRLHELEERSSVDILPILGVGGAPFRGNFRPDNVMNCGQEYPSVQTFTVQSSFKYDHPFRDVSNAIDMLNHSERGEPLPIEEKKALSLAQKIREEYQGQIAQLHPLINGLARFIPPRRARKLHVGLFGYSRSLKGVHLPRAISFCAAFYSVGLPPELLGLSALNEKDWDLLHTLYSHLDEDLQDTTRYVNPHTIERLPGEVKKGVQKVLARLRYEENEEYVEVTDRVYAAYDKGDEGTIREEIRRAAWMRKFLG